MKCKGAPTHEVDGEAVAKPTPDVDAVVVKAVLSRGVAAKRLPIMIGRVQKSKQQDAHARIQSLSAVDSYTTRGE